MLYNKRNNQLPINIFNKMKKEKLCRNENISRVKKYSNMSNTTNLRDL